MKATIRKRKIQNGAFYSLRLDIYPPVLHPETGKLVRWMKLDMRLYVNPKTAEERLENKDAKALAEAVRSRVQLELQAGHYGFLHNQAQVDFMEYYAKLAKEKATNKYRREAWESARKKFVAFAGLKPGEPFYFSRFNKNYLEDFRTYLLAEVSNNTAATYFTQIRTALNHAYRHEVVKTRFTEHVKGIAQKRTKIVYITQEELKLLYNTSCSNPLIKTAALFSALTGMRFSDIEVLRWEDIGYDKEGFFIHFEQRKTGTVNYLPVSETAVQLLGKEGQGVIFPEIRKIHYHSHKDDFKHWIAAAGIKKKVTFHTMRHTFATLQLIAKTDLKTVSVMLGHADMKTTMIYLQLADESSRLAADKIVLVKDNPTDNEKIDIREEEEIAK